MGGVNGVGGKLGMLYYDDMGGGQHSNQWTATDFELACCGSDTECKPKPPKPGHYTVSSLYIYVVSPLLIHPVARHFRAESNIVCLP